MSFTDEFAVHLAAPPDRVYRALVDPADLQAWLAEHADVSLVDGRFGFWGRYTPDGLAGPRQRLLEAEDGRLLRFAWTIGDVETTTEFRVEPGKDGGTRLTISQSGIPTQEALEAGKGTERAILWTWWLVPASRLADYLEGRQPGPWIDFAAMSGDEMRVSMDIGASPAELFASLVSPDELNKWFGMNARVDPRVGGELEIHEGYGAVTIVELEPGRRLAFTRGDDRPGAVVRWELEGSAGRTHLTFVMSGFDDDNPWDVGEWGGWMHGLSQLKRLHETGSVVPLELGLGQGA